jgi:hypothetical protein
MPTCALCESSQPVGESCDVCGRPFPASEAVPVPVQPLEGLEATRHDATRDAPTAPLAELESTAAREAGSVPAEVVEGFAPTAAAPVTVEVTPLEVERVEDAVLEGAGAPGPVACRYCRTAAPPGARFCAVCGMRLPLVRPLRAAGDALGEPCRDCGIPMSGAQCPACGARRGALR